MPTVTFRAKVEQIHNVDGSPAYQRIKVPALARKHCDMHAFRTHPAWGGYANSDLFPSMLRRGMERAGVPAYIRLDQPPGAVRIDTSGFLAVVTVEL